MEAMIRFGRWDDVLAEPETYADYMAFSHAFHHAARSIAYAAKGDAASARKEQSTFWGDMGPAIQTQAHAFVHS